MRSLLLPGMFVLLSATGCGVADQVQVRGPTADPIAITDARSNGARQGYRGPERGGERRHFGDAELAPAPATLLAGALAAHGRSGPGGNAMPGVTPSITPGITPRVVLNDFSVEVFTPGVRLPDASDVATTTTTAGGVGAVVGYGVVAGIETARSRKAITVRIAGSVDGHPFAVVVDEEVRGRVTGARIGRVVRRALDQAATAATQAAAQAAAGR
jgi:hypothetical protein